MITIYNLNVGQADCILVRFKKNEKYFNLLVDGAYKKSEVKYKLDEILAEQEIQGIVISHLDSDHISGILDLVQTKYPKIQSSFLLFNKYDSGLVSYCQARKLAEEFEKSYPANKLIKSYEETFTKEMMEQFKGNDKLLPIRIYSLAQRQMKEQIDRDLVYITILGPTMDHVKKFMQGWHESRIDPETINRSSIMLLLEFDGKAVILPGDGYYTDIREAIAEIENLKKIHVVKTAHHGALKNNYGLPDLVIKYKIDHVFFTIDEGKYNSKQEHPSPELLAKLQETGVKMTCSTNIDMSVVSQGGLQEPKKLCNYMEQQEKIEVEVL